MTTSSESEPTSSSSSRWVWLWMIMKFFWGSIVLAILINLLTSDVILFALFSWIEQHWLFSALLGTGLVMLSAVAWWASRHPSRTSSLMLPLSLEDQNRHRFLTKLQNRYTDILKHALQGAAQIELALHSKPDAVVNTARLQFRQTNLPAQVLPAGTSLLDFYDQASGEVLLLGDPGAGKTTLLLSLAQTLCQRARQEQHAPLPVIVNLSTWANARQPLQEWLVEEVVRSYHAPRTVVARWVQENRLLPLLDGLDEVPDGKRLVCIEAINVFTQHHLVPLVVCSRMQEYTTAQRQLVLHNAVVIQPLEEDQVDAYFKAVGELLAGIYSILRENRTLRELVRTPLMLHVITLAYQGVSVQNLPKKGTGEEQQRQIVEHYVQRRLKDQEAGLTQRTLHWLTFLARQMRAHNQTVFYLEQIQPDWLPLGWLRQIYEAFAVKFVGILIGVLVSLFVRVVMNGIVVHPPFAIMDGLVGGLFGGLISGRPFTVFRPMMVAKTWMHRWRHLFLLSISNGALLGITTGIVFTIASDLREGLIFGLCIGLCSFLLSSVIEAGKTITSSGIAPRIQSQRWWHGSLIGSIQPDNFCLGIVASLLTGVCLALSIGLTDTLTIAMSNGLYYMLLFGITSTILSILLLRKPNTVELVEIIGWSVQQGIFKSSSKQKLYTTLFIFLLVSLLYGLVGMGLMYGSSYWLSLGVINGLHSGLIASVLFWVLIGIWTSLSSDMINDHHRIKPNQGIRQSVFNGLVIGLVAGGICGIVGFLIPIIDGRIYDGGMSGWLMDGLAMGIMGALLMALLMGWLASLRHLLLRVLLAHAGLMPWQAIRFLDDSARRILLYKDGGGYRFIHRLFLDYFADLEPSSFPIQH